MNAEQFIAEVQRRLEVAMLISDNDVALCIMTSITDMMMNQGGRATLTDAQWISMFALDVYSKMNDRLGQYLLDMTSSPDPEVVKANIEASTARATALATDADRALCAPIIEV